MGKIISNPKNYTGNELESVFFRPLVSGPSALDLGIRMMYNMPVPTTLNFWKRGVDLLQKYSAGWNGSSASDKYQKVIKLSKVKAEMGYGAEDYFSMVYERIAGSPEVNLGDLSGTELEEAETALFRESIAESIRATMWVGDTARSGGFNTFDGFFKRLMADTGTGADDVKRVEMTSMATAGNAEKLFKAMYAAAPAELRSMKADGHLVLLVTRDVAENYEESLLSGSLDSVRAAKINGIDRLSFRGIPVVDIQADAYLTAVGDQPTSWAILTDSRNLAVAVNTSDFPGSEVAMWYNPDQMENRQRATFMAGCDYLLPELIVTSYTAV